MTVEFHGPEAESVVLCSATALKEEAPSKRAQCMCSTVVCSEWYLHEKEGRKSSG